MPLNYTPGLVNQQSLYTAPVANLGISPPIDFTSAQYNAYATSQQASSSPGMSWNTAGGIASSAANMGVGGMVGTGIGAVAGGPMGALVGGTLGGIVDNGIKMWQGNKAANAQKKYLKQRQDLNDRLSAANAAEAAKQWQMSFGQQQQQIDFNQAQTSAQFRQNAWQNYLTSLNNSVTNNMNLRASMMKAGII